MKKPEHQIEQISIEALVPYARNSRTHSDAQVAQIAASIREFGFTNPVLVDADGGIIAGHGRVLAARKLSMAEVPCIRLDYLTDTQRKAYIIADNKLAMNAGWDDEMLALEIKELEAEDFDLALLGFAPDELAAMGSEEPAPGEVKPTGNLSDRFMIPPFSVLNAREGWWQDRKRAWLALGIKSEVGRGGASSTPPPHPPTVTRNKDGTLNYHGTAGQDERFDRQRAGGVDVGRQSAGHKQGLKLLQGQAAPGGSARPACDYSKKQRGDGRGRAISG